MAFFNKMNKKDHKSVVLLETQLTFADLRREIGEGGGVSPKNTLDIFFFIFIKSISN